MEEYMDLKKDMGDWHAVADAAMDIREMNAAITELDNLLDLINDKMDNTKEPNS